jgi:tetratricopeptide (TPR) repeat protein
VARRGGQIHRNRVPVAAPATGANKYWDAIALAALAALCVAVYAGVWSFGFVQFDDPQYVYQNPNIANGLTWRGLQWAFTTGYAMNWHPVTWVSHMVDIQLFGLAPGPPHAINLLLHIGSTLLLFWILATTTGARGASATVAALFAVHPLHVESVAWISERKDVLSTFFWMLTIAAYVRYVEAPSGRRYGLVAICLAIGLMCKPMLVTLPFVLLLLDWWPLRRLQVTRGLKPAGYVLLKEKLPLIALAIASSVATLIAQQRGGAVVRLETMPIALRIQSAVVSYVAYLWKTIWPADLYMFYPHAVSLPAGEVAACAAILIAITAGVLIARSWRYAAVGWFWYLATLVPVIGLVQVGRQAMADRYTYIPLIGVFLIVVWAAKDSIAALSARRWLGPLLAACVILPSAVVARAQVQHWRNDQTLWTHALTIAADLDPRRASLATQYLLAEGNVVPLQTLLFSQASGSDVFPALARQYLGRLFARHDRLDDAIAMFQDAIRLGPTIPEFHGDLAGLYVRQQRLDAAVTEFREAVRLGPNVPEAHRNLAVALAQLGRNDEAVRELQEVLRLKPDAADVRQALADFLRKIGRDPAK